MERNSGGRLGQLAVPSVFFPYMDPGWKAAEKNSRFWNPCSGTSGVYQKTERAKKKQRKKQGHRKKQEYRNKQEHRAK
jgi:hypothetical protein